MSATLISSISAAQAGSSALLQSSAVCTPAWSPTFGGAPGTNGTIEAFASFDDGNGPALYAAGKFTAAGGVAASNVGRWNGSTWSALGTGVPYEVTAMAVFDDGNGPALYVAEDDTFVGNMALARVEKWDGSGWSMVGSGMTHATAASVFDMAVFDDGSGPALYAGGNFTSAGGTPATHLAKWNGASWSAVSGTLNGGVSALATLDDGSGPALYVGGVFTNAGGMPANRIAKFNGSTWSALGAGVNAQVDDIALFDDGSGPKLHACGIFTSAGSAPANHVAKWNGSTWSALGSGTNNRVFDIEVFDDGGAAALYACGLFYVAGGTTVACIAKWNGSAWSALSGTAFPGTSNYPYVLTTFDDGSGPSLGVGGSFTQAGDVPANRIARWNAGGWSTLDDGIQQAVFATRTFDDGTGNALYVAGAFASVAGIPTRCIARWDGSNWSALDGGMGSVGFTYALAIYDDGSGPALYAGGLFTTAGTVPANHVAKWDGAAWSALGSGLTNGTGHVTAMTAFDDGSGPALYVSGYFQNAGGVPVSYIAKWDGSTWSPVGSGLNSAADALLVFDDGGGPALYAGGLFTLAGGVAVNRIAKWDGASWSAVGIGFDSQVEALAVFDDGSGPALYAGGYFQSADGLSANRVAKWNGASWSALGSGLNATCLELASFDDGTGPALWAGGSFTSAGGVPATRIARWNGSSWSALGTGMDDDVETLTAFDDGYGAALYAGGRFAVSPASDSYLAKWGCALPTSGTPYCTAGTTSNGCVPAISGTGSASASASSGFTISVASVEGQKQGLIFYGAGNTAFAPLPWGTGASFLCVKSPLQRTPAQSSGGTIGQCDGALTLDWNAFSASAPGALGAPFAAGQHIYAQGWFRDPPAPKTTNLSDALEVTFVP